MTVGRKKLKVTRQALHIFVLYTSAGVNIIALSNQKALLSCVAAMPELNALVEIAGTVSSLFVSGKIVTLNILRILSLSPVKHNRKLIQNWKQAPSSHSPSAGLAPRD
jgi:hypothetical protein